MRSFLFLTAASVLLPLTAGAVNDEHLTDKVQHLDSVVISASRASKSSPVTFTMVGKEVLRKENPINSIPMALSLQPSVVTSSEGGTGLGYSKMTVRGSKGSQINVTLNGITLNDAESQEVFWVNIPALSNILSSIQLQRGLGTSANGSGAFGASVNMSTASVDSEPSVYFDLSRGSFNTFTSFVSASTGLTKSGFYASGAYSRSYTDGYIRNAKAKVQSAFATLGWMKLNNSLKLTYLMGDQHTGITWMGIPLSIYGSDRRYNSAGGYKDSLGNTRYYDNQTDNYTQHHIQLNYTHQFESNLVWGTTVNYTKGDGYYEEYHNGVSLADYGFSQTDKSGDLIVRQEMDNYYLVLNSNLSYTGRNCTLTGGAFVSRYDGDHFGSVLWSDIMGEAYDYSSDRWYLNNGTKDELTFFARAEYSPLDKLNFYTDLQYRGVKLDMEGPDENQVAMDYEKTWNFFNPRVGATFDFSDSHKTYFSVALGHREPGRSDLKNNIETVHEEIAAGNTSAEVSLKPERMVDVELGYAYSTSKFSVTANLYMMEYRDMLLETGKLSDVGYAIKENVPKSFRRGVELIAGWKPFDVLKIDANATLSRNKIKDYTSYVNYYDNLDSWTYLGQKKTYYDKTAMLMSPSVTGAFEVALTPFKNLFANSLKTTKLSFSGKYVGKQYWDNTQDSDRMIPQYFTAGLSLTHTFNLGGGKLGLGVYVNNLLNNKYYADAWVYRAYFEKEGDYQEEGLFPQAPVNAMLRVTYGF
ncbi:MAG: TonB-dependent receptor [Bacteroidales bacterium]